MPTPFHKSLLYHVAVCSLSGLLPGYRRRQRKLYSSEQLLKFAVAVRSGGNAGLMESEENEKPFPSLPTTLGNRKERDYHITTARLLLCLILTFLLGSSPCHFY
jgi:hypothetical protein